MFLENPACEALIDAAVGLKPSDHDAVLVMVGEKCGIDLSCMVEGLNKRGVVFFGGLFPGIVHGGIRSDDGASLTVLPSLCRPFLFRDISRRTPDVGALKSIRDSLNRQYTALVLVDGLATNISLFLQGLFNTLGNSVHYLGGGAGSLSLIRRPCVFNNEGVFQDAAVVSLAGLRSNLGVEHGWKKLAGPLVATKTARNVIAELNWEPAFAVYRRTVERFSGVKISPDTFFDAAKGFPFGMMKEGAEDVVRDPIAVTEEGELVCVGEIPENAVLHILRGEDNELLGAAGRATDFCLQGLDGRDVHAGILFDCISRALFLGDFPAELGIIQDRLSDAFPHITLTGAMTLGEISSYGRNYLEFLNKTVVLGVLYR
jgi:hypothetical protein